jgi:hypothetical protein
VKYYLILLLYGKVIQINSYDTQESRDEQFTKLCASMHDCSEYDEVQTLNEVI